MGKPKVYTVTMTRHDYNGDKCYNHSGTVDELVEYYNKILRDGQSHEYENGSYRINMHPKTISSLLTELHNSCENTYRDGHITSSFSAVETAYDSRDQILGFLYKTLNESNMIRYIYEPGNFDKSPCHEDGYITVPSANAHPIYVALEKRAEDEYRIVYISRDTMTDNDTEFIKNDIQMLCYYLIMKNFIKSNNSISCDEDIRIGLIICDEDRNNVLNTSISI